MDDSEQRLGIGGFVDNSERATLFGFLTKFAIFRHYYHWSIHQVRITPDLAEKPPSHI